MTKYQELKERLGYSPSVLEVQEAFEEERESQRRERVRIKKEEK